MTVFLAGRKQIRIRQLHRRIKNRCQSDDRFGTVQLRVAEPRDSGPYRVIGDVNAQQFLDDTTYSTTTARLEIGFQIPDQSSHEFYWFNWVEPERQLLLGWHRDDDHPNLGPTHMQVTHGGTAVEHQSAVFIDKHPMAVVDARLQQLPTALAQVEWKNGAVVGIDQ